MAQEFPRTLLSGPEEKILATSVQEKLRLEAVVAELGETLGRDAFTEEVETATNLPSSEIIVSFARGLACKIFMLYLQLLGVYSVRMCFLESFHLYAVCDVVLLFHFSLSGYLQTAKDLSGPVMF